MTQDSRFRSGGNQSSDRQSRSAESREITEERNLQDEDRLAAEVADLLSDVLPSLPPIRGFHVCWLTTSSNTDTVAKRMRLGYVPVVKEDVPQFEHLQNAKGTASEGLIQWNEMVAYKIPMERYQALMRHLHHNKPMEDERMIAENAKEAMADKSGKPLIRDVGDGTASLGEDVRAPRFR